MSRETRVLLLAKTRLRDWLLAPPTSECNEALEFFAPGAVAYSEKIIFTYMNLKFLFVLIVSF